MQSPGPQLDTSAATPRRNIDAQGDSQPEFLLRNYVKAGVFLGFGTCSFVGLYLWTLSSGSCLAASIFFVIVCPMMMGIFFFGWGLPGALIGATVGVLFGGFVNPRRFITVNEPTTLLWFRAGWGLLSLAIVTAIYFGLVALYKQSQTWGL